MSEPSFIFDVHLDLSMNALEWNRDLRWPLEKIRRWEGNMKDRVDRGHGTVCLPEMRKGRIGLCVGTQIGRYSPYFHKLAGNPAVANTGIKLIDNARFRDVLLKSLYKKAQGPQHIHK